jgi:hypothetical protein
VLFGVAKTQSGTPVTAGTLIEAGIGNVNYAQTVNQSTGAGSQDTLTHSLTGSGLNYGASAYFQICTYNPGYRGSRRGCGRQSDSVIRGGDSARGPAVNRLPAGRLTSGRSDHPLVGRADSHPCNAIHISMHGRRSALRTRPRPRATAISTPTATPTPTHEPIPVVSAWGPLAILGAVLAMLTALAVHRKPDAT